MEREVTLIDTTASYGFGRSEENRRPRDCPWWAALARGDRHSGGTRKERRKGLPQWQPRPHPARSDGLVKAVAHRLHRHLSGALDRSFGPEQQERSNVSEEDPLFSSAIFAGDYEVMVPFQALTALGHNVLAVCLGKKAGGGRTIC